MNTSNNTTDGNTSPVLKWGLIALAAIAVVAVVYYFMTRPKAPSTQAVPTPTASAMPTQVLPAKTAVPTPTQLPAPTPTLAPAVTVDYNVPANAIAIKDDKGAVKVYTYPVNNPKGAFQVEYPYQSTVIVALGAATVDNGVKQAKLETDGTVGNIYPDICTSQAGCRLTLSGFKAGHVQVTVIFGGKEVPAESLAWAVNNMLASASNCGASACKTVVVSNVGGDPGKTLSFTAKMSAKDVAQVLTAPKPPYATVNPVYKGVPAGAQVIMKGTTPIGQVYFLADPTADVSVPEGGVTVFYCGAKAEVGGKTCKAGMAIAEMGAKSDGSTPADLNDTVTVTSNDPSMIKVYFVYGGDPSSFVDQLKSDHPDWVWK